MANPRHNYWRDCLEGWLGVGRCWGCKWSNLIQEMNPYYLWYFPWSSSFELFQLFSKKTILNETWRQTPVMFLLCSLPYYENDNIASTLYASVVMVMNMSLRFPMLTVNRLTTCSRCMITDKMSHDYCSCLFMSYSVGCTVIIECLFGGILKISIRYQSAPVVSCLGKCVKKEISFAICYQT